MAKVLLVTEDYWPRRGGVANYYGGLVNALVGQVAVLTSVPGEEDIGVFRVNYFLNFFWPRWLPLLWFIPKYLKKSGAKAVWVGDILPVGTACWILNKFINLPYIVNLHSLDLQLTQVSPKKKRRRWLAQKILSGAETVIVNSVYTLSLVQKLNLPHLKTMIIYPVAAKFPEADKQIMESLKDKYALQGKKVVLTVSRLVSRKGIDDVIRAVSLIKDRVSGLHYIVIGAGPQRQELESLIKSEQVPATLVGAVTSEELSAWYELCDAFVLTPKPDPVDVEGYGIVYREAAQFGKPIIAEAVGDQALYAGTPDEISVALLKLLTNNELARQLGDQARQLSVNVSLATEAAKLQAVIDAL